MALTYQNVAYAFYLNAGEYNGAFDAIYFQTKPTPPAIFENANFGGSCYRPSSDGDTRQPSGKSVRRAPDPPWTIKATIANCFTNERFAMIRNFGQAVFGLLTALSAMFAASLPAYAAQLSMTNNGAIYTFYVDGESLNGGFETIHFQAKGTPPGKFANVAIERGVPRPPGQALTYRNQMLTADPLDFPGAFRLTAVGEVLKTGQEISYTLENRLGMITTANEPNGDLFLANLYIPDPTIFTATVQLISAGTVVFEATQTIPEPIGAGAALLGVVALLPIRRRFS